MTWALSLLHAAVLNDDDAVTEMLAHRMRDASESDDPVTTMWMVLVSLIEAGVVYALLFAEASRMSPEDVIATVGNFATIWEANTG
jgi:hypothetical protein